MRVLNLLMFFLICKVEYIKILTLIILYPRPFVLNYVEHTSLGYPVIDNSASNGKGFPCPG
jgi:hypothetical protein